MTDNDITNLLNSSPIPVNSGKCHFTLFVKAGRSRLTGEGMTVPVQIRIPDNVAQLGPTAWGAFCQSLSGEMTVQDTFRSVLCRLWTTVMTGDCDRRIDIEEKIPDTWWDAFKLRWFPDWAQKKYPAKFRRISVHEKINLRICPHHDSRASTNPDHVEFLLPSEVSPFHTFWFEQAKWSREVFGPDHVRGPVGPLKHLAKEVDECLNDPNDLEEYADLLFLLCDATRRAGFDPEGLFRAAFAKLEKNKAREWPAFDPSKVNEAVEHDRSKE